MVSVCKSLDLHLPADRDGAMAQTIMLALAMGCEILSSLVD